MSTSTLKRDPLFNKLMAQDNGHCLTILMATHRTAPENAQDTIRLKDLAREAEHRLLELGSKRDMAPWLERLESVQQEIDHQHNWEGLGIFIGRDLTEVVRFPFPVEDRTVLDDTFATRELVRARLGSVDYHVLVMSRDKAHLYHATDDKLLGEVKGGFPFENKYWTTNADLVTTSKGQDNQARQYYLALHRALHEKVGDHARVVVACTGEHHSPFLEAADHSGIYVGHLDGNHEHEAGHEVVKRAWTIAYEDQKKRHASELDMLNKTPVERQATAIADIWRHVNQGRGSVLYVERDVRIPVRFEGEAVVKVEDATADGVVDDIVDDIIEVQLRHGGDVRILPNGLLAGHKGIALVLRY
ncbi:MAG: hypothetical protein KDC03_03205 [Flavobacteriales bacterium]|nr:hypothetical protein [Flavobacteriales bacterium]